MRMLRPRPERMKLEMITTGLAGLAGLAGRPKREEMRGRERDVTKIRSAARLITARAAFLAALSSTLPRFLIKLEQGAF